MKTAAEIRRHRDNLLVCMKVPCGCRGTQHRVECLVGLKMMKATSETLSWLLGENDAMQDLVDRMERDVRDITASN